MTAAKKTSHACDARQPFITGFEEVFVSGNQVYTVDRSLGHLKKRLVAHLDQPRRMRPCWDCNSLGSCTPSCRCLKCRDPESYRDWVRGCPGDHQRWVASQWLRPL